MSRVLEISVSESLYIETSILGYLTARSTENLILAANIKITQDWWDIRRNSFTLYTSEIVEDEATRGDAEIANRRLSLLQSLMFLNLTEEATELHKPFCSEAIYLQKLLMTHYT